MMSRLCSLLLTTVLFAEAIMNEQMNNTLNKMKFQLMKTEAKKGEKSFRIKRSDVSSCWGNNSLFFDENVSLCCKKCPKGEYVKSSCTVHGQDPLCQPCGAETFLEFSNYKTKCKACSHCDTATENTEKRCSAASNTKCICKEGRYRDSAHICTTCRKCENREVIKNCSGNEDGVCGDCLPGFYEEENNCLPCTGSHQNPCGNETSPECLKLCKPRIVDLPVAYLVVGALTLLLSPVGGLLIYRYKKNMVESLGKHVFISQGPEKNLQDLNENCPESSICLKPEDPPEPRLDSSNLLQGQLTSVLQRGRTLYDIIDCVPIKRWKEFMRTLELPDKEIELVEIEISNYRDQQYEMLRRWSQLKNSTLEFVYETLERMNLSGCAEELREKLESYA